MSVEQISKAQKARLKLAEGIISDAEVWMVLGIARDAHPDGIKNAIYLHNRIRDFLGLERIDWSDYVERTEKIWGRERLGGAEKVCMKAQLDTRPK